MEDQVLQRKRSNGRVKQPSTFNERIDQLATTESDNRTSSYLLIVGNHNINNQDGREYTQRQFETFDNYRQ